MNRLCIHSDDPYINVPKSIILTLNWFIVTEHTMYGTNLLKYIFIIFIHTHSTWYTVHSPSAFQCHFVIKLKNRVKLSKMGIVVCTKNYVQSVELQRCLVGKKAKNMARVEFYSQINEHLWNQFSMSTNILIKYLCGFSHLI